MHYDQIIPNLIFLILYNWFLITSTPRKLTWQWKITIFDRRYMGFSLSSNCRPRSLKVGPRIATEGSMLRVVIVGVIVQMDFHSWLAYLQFTLLIFWIYDCYVVVYKTASREAASVVLLAPCAMLLGWTIVGLVVWWSKADFGGLYGFWFDVCKEECTSPKTDMAMENPPFEDVLHIFPTENRGFCKFMLFSGSVFCVKIWPPWVHVSQPYQLDYLPLNRARLSKLILVIWVLVSSKEALKIGVNWGSIA